MLLPLILAGSSCASESKGDATASAEATRSAPTQSEASDQESEVATPTPAKTEYAAVRIEGMTCGGCAWEITDKLTKMDGVRSVDVNLEGQCAAIGYEPEEIQPKALLAAFDELGYSASPLEGDSLVGKADGGVQCIGASPS